MGLDSAGCGAMWQERHRLPCSGIHAALAIAGGLLQALLGSAFMYSHLGDRLPLCMSMICLEQLPQSWNTAAQSCEHFEAHFLIVYMIRSLALMGMLHLKPKIFVSF